jgi:hypothetical protein
MIIKIHTIRFSKEYFSSYEKCAAWLDEKSVRFSTYEEVEQFYIFEQVAKDKFNEASLQEISLGSGVKAVVGLVVSDETTLANVTDSDSIVPDNAGLATEGMSEEEQIMYQLSSGLDALKKYFAEEETEEETEDEGETEEPEPPNPLVRGVVTSAISKSNPPVNFQVPIIKKTAERIVFGEVLVPNTVDAQGHIYSEQEVEKAAHYWMKEFQQLGEMHSKMLKEKQATVLESYVAPVEFSLGEKIVKKGTWLLKLYVDNDDLWEKVESGDYNGFSIRGLADAETLDGED